MIFYTGLEIPFRVIQMNIEAIMEERWSSLFNTHFTLKACFFSIYSFKAKCQRYSIQMHIVINNGFWKPHCSFLECMVCGLSSL